MNLGLVATCTLVLEALTSLVYFSYQVIKVLKRSKHRLNISEIRHIVAKIHHRGRVDRAQPDDLHPNVLQMVQPGDDSWKQKKRKISTVQHRRGLMPGIDGTRDRACDSFVSFA